jgi:DNA-directed RNA polymerase I subunit RPA1
VTPWNVVELRDAVLNGPDTHPGATRYADKSSNKRLHPDRNVRSHIAKRLQSTRGVFMHHGKIHDQEFEGKIVYRHLKDGDVVLVNRQVLHYISHWICFNNIINISLSYIPLIPFSFSSFKRI